MNLGERLQRICIASEPHSLGSLRIIRISLNNNEVIRANAFVDALIEQFRSAICSDILPMPVRVPDGAPFRTYQWPEHVERFDSRSYQYAEHLNRFFDWCDENGLVGVFQRKSDWDPDSINHYYEVQVLAKAG